MRYVKNAVLSGSIGISIGMVWFAVELLLSLKENIFADTISTATFLFWLVVSFAIGLFFYFAGLIFSIDDWSLRKQIFINFFVCFSAYFLLCLATNNFDLSFELLIAVVGNFVIMYLLAYGIYFLHLWREVKQINEKLQQKENK